MFDITLMYNNKNIDIEVDESYDDFDENVDFYQEESDSLDDDENEMFEEESDDDDIDCLFPNLDLDDPEDNDMTSFMEYWANH